MEADGEAGVSCVKNSAWKECAEIGETRRASPMGTQSESEFVGEAGKGEAGKLVDIGDGDAPKTASSAERSPATRVGLGRTKWLRLSTSCSSSP